jgi:hypothetical protein
VTHAGVIVAPDTQMALCLFTRQCSGLPLPHSPVLDESLHTSADGVQGTAQRALNQLGRKGSRSTWQRARTTPPPKCRLQLRFRARRARLQQLGVLLRR